MIRRLAGYYVDANLLVLLAVGDEGRDLIPKHKPTGKIFSRGLRYFAKTRLRQVRPGVSDTKHAYRGFKSARSASASRSVPVSYEKTPGHHNEKSEETRCGQRDSIGQQFAFERLGLTDAALLEVATALRLLLLTVDTGLHRAALNRGQRTPQ